MCHLFIGNYHRHKGTHCKQNLCVFTKSSYPRDITCNENNDCINWIPPCQNNRCSSIGSKQCLQEKLGDFICECHTNYTGRFCEYTNQPIECNDDYCMNDGLCITENDTYSCSCNDKFMGKHCQLIKIPNENWMCQMPQLKESVEINNSTWYAILVSDHPYIPQTACSVYQFQNSDTLQLNIKQLSMSHFHIQNGIQEINYTLDKVNYFYLIENYKDLPSSSPSNNTVVRTWIDIFVIGKIKYMLMWFCTQDELYREQQSVIILSNKKQQESFIELEKYLKTIGLSNFREINQNIPACNHVYENGFKQ